jgi:DGQHR domain-containing protein
MVKAKKAAGSSLSVPVVVLSADPAVYLSALPGQWLLAHSTPSWRIDDPKRGFQRIVKEQRAKEIARTVLDPGRTFPNAITLATTTKEFAVVDGQVELPVRAKFLVVDGQHRLWAQHFSKVNGTYPCIIHMGRTEEQMAALFLEINDNQRRVPSSLRWDLVRLVRNEDQSTVITADVVYELATRNESPFNSVGIDLTGEKKDVTIKQGSLAPEIRTLVSRHLKKGAGTLDDYVGLLVRFFVAVRSLDPEGWGDPQSAFFKARVLRAMIRVLSDLLDAKDATIEGLTTDKLRTYFARIDQASLSNEAVRRVQGSTGVQDLYKQMKGQVIRAHGS